jgi:hypothetical protein
MIETMPTVDEIRASRRVPSDADDRNAATAAHAAKIQAALATLNAHRLADEAALDRFAEAMAGHFNCERMTEPHVRGHLRLAHDELRALARSLECK